MALSSVLSELLNICFGALSDLQRDEASVSLEGLKIFNSWYGRGTNGSELMEGGRHSPEAGSLEAPCRAWVSLSLPGLWESGGPLGLRAEAVCQTLRSISTF